ncbi:MAG: arylamine N-acetyltransferase [Gemmatimonadaceae bacterium]
MPISEKLRLRMATRLALDPRVETNVQGLFALYEAWCRNVPFDNVRKLISLRTGDPGALPGGDATDFMEAFLEHGTGGTCWSSSNALFELVSAFGFQARRVAGSMRDLGVPGHGSVKVTIDEMDWMVDSSMLTMFPIPITRELYVFRDPRFGVEVEPTPEDSHLVWFNTPPYADYFPCRLLMDNVTHDFYLERYEISRTRGPFNHHISIRYNRGDARTVLQGHTRHRTTDAAGLRSQPLTREELVIELRDVVGLSDTIIKRWVECGALEAQYEPPENPPALLTVKPPSTRGN